MTMKRMMSLAVVAAIGLIMTPAGNANAKSRKYRAKNANTQLSQHPKSRYYRRRSPQVRGFRKRVGGYSYTFADTINTYGDARTRFGSTNSYRDPMLGRQTTSGPFDHGFFFESGVAPRGGNSPYLN